MELVSIIIPVYNGEKHIKNCLEQVLKQTYKNIEVIVINDGSTDSTESILKKVSKNDYRIKVINKKNTGVSDTRNIGISISNGKYILFLDSDDSFELDAIEKIMKKKNNLDIDMLIYGFTVKGSKNRLNDTQVLKKMENSFGNKKEIIKSIISTNNNIYGYIWRALYSKSLLVNNNIKFPIDIKISEDYMFFLNAIYNSKNILIDSNEYYIYNLNESSMSTKYVPTLLDDMLFVNNWMYNNIVLEDSQLIKGYYCCMCNTYLRFVQNEIRNKNTGIISKMQYIKNIKKEHRFQKYINEVWYKCKYFNLKSFIAILLFRFRLDYIYIILFYIKEKF